MYFLVLYYVIFVNQFNWLKRHENDKRSLDLFYEYLVDLSSMCVTILRNPYPMQFIWYITMNRTVHVSCTKHSSVSIYNFYRGYRKRHLLGFTIPFPFSIRTKLVTSGIRFTITFWHILAQLHYKFLSDYRIECVSRNNVN